MDHDPMAVAMALARDARRAYSEAEIEIVALRARVAELEANRLTTAERAVIEAAVLWGTNDPPGMVLTEENDPVMILQRALAALQKERNR